MRKFQLLILVLLVGCSDDENSELVVSQEVTMDEIINDAISQKSLNEIEVNIQGTYLYKYPVYDCDGFCMDESQVTSEDFTFVNSYQPENYNLCGNANFYEFVSSGHKLRLINISVRDIQEVCEGEFEVKLNGRLYYDLVMDYCSMQTHPSAYLELDEKSIQIINDSIDCAVVE